MLMTNVRKGTIVRLRNGFRAKVEDNLVRGMTRLCTVYGAEFGMFDEMGSVYSSDIVQAEVNGMFVSVQLTPAQAKSAKTRAAFGF